MLGPPQRDVDATPLELDASERSVVSARSTPRPTRSLLAVSREQELGEPGDFRRLETWLRGLLRAREGAFQCLEYGPRT